MGTWEGHISPGVAFYSFGIVFCFQNSWKYFTKGRKFNKSPPSTTLGKIRAKVKEFPLDSFLKILYGFGAAMAELFYPPGTNKLVFTNDSGHWVHLNEWQHFTMYSFFAINGVIDIVSQKFLKKRAIVLEKAAVAMAFYVTALLLFYHRHGKHELEMEAHGLLFYATLGMCLSLTLEIWRPEDIRLIWLHTLLVMQMGSWLFNLAFILFRPIGGVAWDGDDHTNLAVLPIFFAWHLFLNCIVMGLIHIVAYFYYKVRASKSYKALSDTELHCCLPSSSEGGNFFQQNNSTNNYSRTNGNNQQHDVANGFSIEDDDETPFMT